MKWNINVRVTSLVSAHGCSQSKGRATAPAQELKRSEEAGVEFNVMYS